MLLDRRGQGARQREVGRAGNLLPALRFGLRRGVRRADNSGTMEILLQPTIAGAAFAALAVAGGAPIFSDGLRAFRLRHQLERLTERPLAEEPVGFVHTSGRVLLDSPLFSPLTGKPCAGYRLEVRGPGAARPTVVEERRPFRIVSGDISARVMAGAARWVIAETGQREIAPDESVSEHLTDLLNRSPDVLLLKNRRMPILLFEHALFAGAETHVVGCVRHARPYELPHEMELMRTGTDDVVQTVSRRPERAVELATAPADGPHEETAGAPESAPRKGTGPFGIERRAPGRPFPGEVDLWVDGGGLLDFILVSDAPPASDQLVMSRWRTLGLLLGPALSLTGLLYLAHAADQLHSQGRF